MISGLFKYPKLVSFVVFVLVLASREYVVQLEVAQEREAVWNRARADASSIRADIEGELHSTIYLGIGLGSYLSLDPELSDQTVAQLLENISEQGRNIRNIGLAPDNTIAYVYPLAGNEAALGVRFEDLPEQWPVVQQAMEEKRTVIAGPISLVQGGYGIATRTPVFLQNGEYWGIVSVVVDVDALLDGVSDSHSTRNIEWALRASARDTRSAPYAYGDVGLFGGESIQQTIELPGGLWEIAILPTGTWSKVLFRMQVLRRFVSLLVTAVIALLVYLVLHERAQAHHLAMHDPLTGLPNRHLLYERLEQRITHATRYPSTFHLLFIDLDRFKPINDQYGHRVGDMVLNEIGKRMVAAVRGSDTVARVGGDEFVILLPDTDAASGAEAVGRNLLKAIERPIETDKGSLSVGASIGISAYPDHGMTAEALLAHADGAMYAEKMSGKTKH